MDSPMAGPEVAQHRVESRRKQEALKQMEEAQSNQYLKDKLETLNARRRASLENSVQRQKRRTEQHGAVTRQEPRNQGQQESHNGTMHKPRKSYNGYCPPSLSGLPVHVGVPACYPQPCVTSGRLMASANSPMCDISVESAQPLSPCSDQPLSGSYNTNLCSSMRSSVSCLHLGARLVRPPVPPVLPAATASSGWPSVVSARHAAFDNCSPSKSEPSRGRTTEVRRKNSRKCRPTSYCIATQTALGVDEGELMSSIPSSADQHQDTGTQVELELNQPTEKETPAPRRRTKENSPAKHLRHSDTTETDEELKRMTAESLLQEVKKKCEEVEEVKKKCEGIVAIPENLGECRVCVITQK
eukprot:GHVQ01038590.1.p1 GENE.GHVQ01038590.1~~GHVQ01038590.1.p1  ORF type:complete len:357 (-),score=39.01 GHVQ01038590.1:20-1090(-)